jgi:hypothetical protein
VLSVASLDFVNKYFFKNFIAFVSFLSGGTTCIWSSNVLITCCSRTEHSHVFTWQQPAALQPAQTSISGSKCVSLHSALTVQPHCIFSVTTCVTCGWTFVCKTPRAFDLWLGYWQWLAVTIDWLLTVTIDCLLTVTGSDHWMVTDGDWQWPLTGYWRWLAVTIDWLLTDWQWPLTGYWRWLTVTIDWLLTGHWLVTDSKWQWPLTGYWQWPFKTGTINQEHSNWRQKSSCCRARKRPRAATITSLHQTHNCKTQLWQKRVGEWEWEFVIVYRSMEEAFWNPSGREKHNIYEVLFTAICRFLYAQLQRTHTNTYTAVAVNSRVVFRLQRTCIPFLWRIS